MASDNQIICFFNSCKAWGGGEKWHLEMAMRLHTKGYNVLVCAAPDSRLCQRAKSAGIPVKTFRISNLSFLNPFLHLRLKRFFKALPIKHVLLNLPSDLKTAGFAAHRANIPDIVYRRGSAIPVKNSLINRFLFGKVVHRIIANSEETKRTILQNNQRIINAENIHIIYNGIDLERFDAQEHEPPENEENKLILGNLGRLEPQKNQLFLLDILENIRRKGIPAVLHIGGAGRLEQELRTEINRRNLTNYVHMPGFIDDVKSFMMQLDVFLLPSMWEGFGYVLIEAQACSKPIVAFDTSSNPEIVKHNNTGILVETNNVEQFSDAIATLYNNPKKRLLMGRNGRTFVQQRFDISQTTKKLIEFIEAI
ncbi:MAG: glycosyltransferase family 4 protein [Salinivirgaceae bacterium]|nr:glycosyltransferase family 4 protein [Salinivirgaceae bacterium]